MGNPEATWPELIAEAHSAVDRVNARYEKDGKNWEQDRYNKEISSEMLDFYRKVTDPMNTQVTNRDLADGLANNPNERLASQNELNDVRAIIAEETNRYNALKDTRYPVPQIVIAQGMANGGQDKDHTDDSPSRLSTPGRCY